MYHVNKEIFNAQIIVTKELSPDDSLYLRCLTDKLTDAALIDKLAEDYQAHHEHDQVTYTQYLNQLAIAATNREGGISMDYEGILYFFGTSYEEVTENAMKKAEEYYQPKIDYLQNLLTQHNIPFSYES